MRTRVFALAHDLLDLIDGSRQPRGQQFVTRGSDQNVVLDADADFFFRNIDPRLVGYDHARFERTVGVAGIVNLQADMVAQTVDEVAAEAASFAILAVSIDIVVGDFEKAIGTARPSVIPGFMAASAAFCAPRTIS